MVQNMENIDFRTFFAVTSQQWPLMKRNCDFWVLWNISDQIQKDTLSKFGLFFQKMYKVLKNKAQRCSTPLSTSSLIILFRIKGTNGRQKTYEIFHICCIFYPGFMCITTVIFGITKDGSLESNNLASWNCFTCRNLFQNGANRMSECLTFETDFL